MKYDLYKNLVNIQTILADLISTEYIWISQGLSKVVSETHNLSYKSVLLKYLKIV